jgi:hypothetical protein
VLVLDFTCRRESAEPDEGKAPVFDTDELPLEADGGVERVEKLLTMHLGPRDVLLTAAVRFREGLSAA